jgi:hypothetical protein
MKNIKCLFNDIKKYKKIRCVSLNICLALRLVFIKSDFFLVKLRIRLIVFFKLQPYVQISVPSRAYYKLSFRCCGPFQVYTRVGKVSYKLKLPSLSPSLPVLLYNSPEAQYDHPPHYANLSPSLSFYMVSEWHGP